jgi:hypothetical protein
MLVLILQLEASFGMNSRLLFNGVGSTFMSGLWFSDTTRLIFIDASIAGVRR